MNTTKPVRYIIHENEAIVAASPTELVARLAATSFQPVSPAEFRDRAAKWAKELFNYDITTGTDHDFVRDMISAGFYRIDKPVK